METVCYVMLLQGETLNFYNLKAKWGPQNILADMWSVSKVMQEQHRSVPHVTASAVIMRSRIKQMKSHLKPVLLKELPQNPPAYSLRNPPSSHMYLCLHEQLSCSFVVCWYCMQMRQRWWEVFLCLLNNASARAEYECENEDTQAVSKERVELG